MILNPEFIALAISTKKTFPASTAYQWVDTTAPTYIKDANVPSHVIVSNWQTGEAPAITELIGGYFVDKTNNFISKIVNASLLTGVAGVATTTMYLVLERDAPAAVATAFEIIIRETTLQTRAITVKALTGNSTSVFTPAPPSGSTIVLTSGNVRHFRNTREEPGQGGYVAPILAVTDGSSTAELSNSEVAV